MIQMDNEQSYISVVEEFSNLVYRKPQYWWDDLDNQIYYSYTVAYDKQTAPYTDFSVCGEKKMGDLDVEGLYKMDSPDLTWEEFGISERHVDAMTQLLGDVVITCTVHFDDGTTESADIKVVPKVMTLREAGFGERYPDMNEKELETICAPFPKCETGSR